MRDGNHGAKRQQPDNVVVVVVFVVAAASFPSQKSGGKKRKLLGNGNDDSTRPHAIPTRSFTRGAASFCFPNKRESAVGCVSPGVAAATRGLSVPWRCLWVRRAPRPTPTAHRPLATRVHCTSTGRLCFRVLRLVVLGLSCKIRAVFVVVIRRRRRKN